MTNEKAETAHLNMLADILSRSYLFKLHVSVCLVTRFKNLKGHYFFALYTSS